MVLLAKVFMLLLVLCTLVVHLINERMDKGEHSSVILFVSETYLKVQCVKRRWPLVVRWQIVTN